MRYAGIVLKLLHMCTHKSSVIMLAYTVCLPILPHMCPRTTTCVCRSPSGLRMAGLLGLAKERFVLFFPVTFAALLLGREHCSLGGAYFLFI
jgi:hypothetical protein